MLGQLGWRWSCLLGRLAGREPVSLDGWFSVRLGCLVVGCPLGRSSCVLGRLAVVGCPLLACRQIVCLDGWLVAGVVCLGGHGDADAACLSSDRLLGRLAGRRGPWVVTVTVTLSAWIACWW